MSIYGMTSSGVNGIVKMFFVLAAFIAVSPCVPAYADDCDATLLELSATINGLEVGERVSSNGFDTVTLRNTAAEEIKLTCNRPGAPSRNQITAAWRSAYPPPAYFSFLAATGAVVASNSSAAVQKGALACVKQALSADTEVMQVDLAGVHVYCSASTQGGGRVTISVSSMRDERDLSEKLPDPKNLKANRSK